MNTSGHCCIRKLPDDVSNKIAAGEVVERPASVLKELVENAIDAGATRIDAFVSEAGRKLVAVRDNGCGMSREEAVLCLEPHATSKIMTAEDIERITTLGFRGEAIPSMASVSRFRLATCQKGGEGTEVVMKCGGAPEVHVIGTPEGTLVEVRDLFCNLPARRNFLKSHAAEEALIRKMVMQYAFAHLDISFALTFEGRQTLSLPAGATLKERVGTLLGAELVAGLLEMRDSCGDIEISGLIQQPSGVDTFRREQYVFVNGRPASAPMVNAVLRDLLPRSADNGRPLVVLFIKLPPSQVNVNVHPSKREVQFRNEHAVRAAIVQAVERALEPVRESLVAASSGGAAFDACIPLCGSDAGSFPVNEDTGICRAPQMAAEIQQMLPLRPSGEDACLGNVPYKLLGVSHFGFIVLETERGIVFVDSVAAQERVLFERLMKGDCISQRLLIPCVVSLGPVESGALAGALDELSALGFELDELSPGKWKVDTVPAVVGTGDVESALVSIAAGLAEERRASESDWGRGRLVRCVTGACARMTRMWSPDAACGLVRELLATGHPYVCPKNNARTLLVFTMSELRRRFGA